MVKKYRSSVEIIYDIISAAKSSINKTHLMYDSNLSFKQLRQYPNLLLQQGLIEERFEEEEETKVYYISPKGLEYQTLVERLQAIVGITPDDEKEAYAPEACPVTETHQQFHCRLSASSK